MLIQTFLLPLSCIDLIMCCSGHTRRCCQTLRNDDLQATEAVDCLEPALYGLSLLAMPAGIVTSFR